MLDDLGVVDGDESGDVDLLDGVGRIVRAAKDRPVRRREVVFILFVFSLFFVRVCSC